MQNLCPARVCPECGNPDWDDDFSIMKCSECGCIYDGKKAEYTEI